MSPTYGYVTKLFLESEFQHKGNKQMKNKQKKTKKDKKQKKKKKKKYKKKKKKTRILSEISQFSWQEQFQKIKLFKYYTERDKNIWTKLSSLGQEPTSKSSTLFPPYLADESVGTECIEHCCLNRSSLIVA